MDGVTVTTDAMHCINTTARLIALEKGGKYNFRLRDNQPTMRAHAERLLAREIKNNPHFERCTDYGDRTEIRRIWAHKTDPESAWIYDASQVFVIEREVIPRNKTVKASKESCYSITNEKVQPDIKANAKLLLNTFRGHWTVESKNHNRRDVTYREDASPVKNHNSARIFATMKMLAIFLCEIDAHKPTSERERCLPELNRACAINGIDMAINWITRKHNPLSR